MQHINEIIPAAQSGADTKPCTENFSEGQRMLINWFFSMVRTAWGPTKFISQFGEGDDLRYAKRYWGPKIIQWDRVQLRQMFDAADRERMGGNDKFQWPDVAAILSLEANAWERQCHKPFVPALEDKGFRERSLRGYEKFKREMQDLGFLGGDAA